jgi:hypothetical protein
MPTTKELLDVYEQTHSYRKTANVLNLDRRGVARRIRRALGEERSDRLYKRYIVIPDTQITPDCDTSFISWIGKYICDKRPDVVVMLGDFADMESLSSYDRGTKSFEGRRYKKDIECARRESAKLGAFVRNSGAKAHMLLGNHDGARISRVTELQPELDGVVGVEDLGYAEAGWTVHGFLKVVELDGICFSHYFTSGVMGRPITSAATLLNRKHQSCIAGHQQSKQIAYAQRADGRSITGIIAGSCYPHRFNYLGPQGNEHFRGLLVLNEVHDGEFDECVVSLNFLERRYSHA